MLLLLHRQARKHIACQLLWKHAVDHYGLLGIQFLNERGNIHLVHLNQLFLQ